MLKGIWFNLRLSHVGSWVLGLAMALVAIAAIAACYGMSTGIINIPSCGVG